MARTAAATRKRTARAAALERKSPDAFAPSGAPDRAPREVFFDAVVLPPGNVKAAAASTNAELAAALEEHDRRVVRE